MSHTVIRWILPILLGAAAPSVAFGASTPASTPSLAGDDWFASLYTDGGIELRGDERVTALFLLLNATGYDEAPLARARPVPKHRYTAVRQSQRANLARMPGALTEAIDRFYDAHPVSIDRYLGVALFGNKAGGPDELAGFEPLLNESARVFGLEARVLEMQEAQRRASRSYLPLLDAPVSRVRQLVGMPSEGWRMVVMVNLLEGQGITRGALGTKELWVSVGADEQPRTFEVTRAIARAWLAPKVEAQAERQWKGGPALLKEARAAGATDVTVGEYAVSLLATAAGLSATSAGAEGWSAADRSGYFGVEELAKGFESGRPVESWMMDALSRVEARRQASRR